MAGELVFLTGATGFIGSQTAFKALEAGYRLRLAVRKSEQIETLKNLFSTFSSRLEFVIVSDFTAPSAFDNVLEGVQHIVHIASPMAGKGGDDLHTGYVDPAVKGTISVLEAARKTPSIKRVVITSSVYAVVPIDVVARNGLSDGYVIRAEHFEAAYQSLDPKMVFPDGVGGAILKYQFSKIMAHHESIDFMRSRNPGFSLVTLHPTFVIGRSPIQEISGQPDVINAWVWDSLRSENPPLPCTCVDVQDVADAHVKSLDFTTDKKVSSFLISGPPYDWPDVVDFVKKNYPQIDVKLKQVQRPYVADTSRAAQILGMKWRSMEETIRSLVDQQLASS